MSLDGCTFLNLRARMLFCGEKKIKCVFFQCHFVDADGCLKAPWVTIRFSDVGLGKNPNEKNLCTNNNVQCNQWSVVDLRGAIAFICSPASLLACLVNKQMWFYSGFERHLGVTPWPLPSQKQQQQPQQSLLSSLLCLPSVCAVLDPLTRNTNTTRWRWLGRSCVSNMHTQ